MKKHSEVVSEEQKHKAEWSQISPKVPQRHSVFTPGGVLHSNNYLRLFVCSLLLFDLFKYSIKN